MIFPDRTITYRFQIEHQEKVRLFLANNDATIGYRIKKLELMPRNFGNSSNELESTVKCYTVDPGEVTTDWDAVINLDDSSIIACATLGLKNPADTYPMIMNATLDAVPFNQDLYVVHWNNHGDALGVNVLLEIEQFSIGSLTAASLCLKNMRNLASKD